MSNKYANLTFQAALKAFQKSNLAARELAVICSRKAIEHYYGNGDTAYLQQFMDAMADNWNRKAAFVRWACEHADVILQNKVWKKDRSPEALKVTDAMKNDALTGKSFFDYAPEAPVLFFGPADIDAAIKKALAPFESKRYKPEGEEAVIHLEKVKAKLRRAGLLYAEQPDLEAEEQAAAAASSTEEQPVARLAS